MAYLDPEKVVSPKGRWELGRVLCTTGDGGFSIAEGSWDGEPAIGIRWNGSDHSDDNGSPWSRHAVWFMLPNELHESARSVASSVATRKATG